MMKPSPPMRQHHMMTMPVNVMMTSRHPHDRRARLLRVLAVLLAALMFALTTMVDNVSASGSNTRTIDVNAFSNDAALRRYAIGDTIDAGDTLAAHTGIDKSMADGMYVDDNDGDDDDSGYESSSSTFGNAFAATAAFAEQSTAESKYTGAPTTTTTALDRPRPRGNRRLKIVVLTVGSRGDVQYIIPFCVRLRQLGHRCTVATHEHFRAMITSHGIGFRPVAGDPNEIIKECVESGLFSMQFLLKNGLGEGLRPWMDALYKTAHKAVPVGTDLLIATPSAMVGYHIAEALRIPIISLFPMPVTPSKLYPHPFVATPASLGPFEKLYNRVTHKLLNYGWYLGMRSQINSWREQLGLEPWNRYNAYGGFWADQIGMSRRVRKSDLDVVPGVPAIYPISPTVLPRDPKWGSNVHVVGYWFLEKMNEYQPSLALVDFLERKLDKRPVIFIGFGSMKVKRADEFTKKILRAVHKLGVRVVLSMGWSDESTVQETSEEQLKRLACAYLPFYRRFGSKEDMCYTEMKKTVFLVNDIPHDWLFSKVDIIVHHGGAGTTATAIKAGRPQVIVPFFGDQFWWAKRIKALRLGNYVNAANGRINVRRLVRVISKVMRDKRIATAAAKMPETLRRENGVEQGVKVVLDEYELAIRDGGSRWDRELAVRAEEMKLKRTLFVHVVQYFERKVGKLSVWYRDRQRRHATPEEKRSTELLTQISDPPKDIPDDHLLDDGNSMNMDHVDSAVPIDGESQIGQNKVGTIGHVSENNHEMISVA